MTFILSPAQETTTLTLSLFISPISNTGNQKLFSLTWEVALEIRLENVLLSFFLGLSQ